MAGADVFTIQAALGHGSVTMSQRYVHPTPESLKRAIRGMIEQDRLWREAEKGFKVNQRCWVMVPVLHL
jgi:hypothetical protein